MEDIEHHRDQQTQYDRHPLQDWKDFFKENPGRSSTYHDDDNEDRRSMID